MLTRRFEYIVQPDDTLFGIALKFNVPIDALKELNNLENPELIYVGQEITVPVSEEFYQIAQLVKSQCIYPNPAQSVSASAKNEDVGEKNIGANGKEGSADALNNGKVSAVGAKAAVTGGSGEQNYFESNEQFDPNILNINRQGEETPFEAQIDGINANGKMFLKRYRVRRGDTVYLLAKEYNTTTGNILALNPQITDVRNIPIGSVITIPIPPKEAIVYVVRPGDTLYKIAKAHNTTVEEIRKYNYLKSEDILYPGQQIVIVR